MTELAARKLGESLGKVLSGGAWGLYIGGIISMIGSAFITPLPITTFFITVFGWASVLGTIFAIVVLFSVRQEIKKDEFTLLQSYYKTKLHEKGTTQQTIGIFVHFILSVFALFVMGNLVLFLQIFSVVVMSNMLLIETKHIIRRIKQHENVLEFLEKNKEFQKVAEKQFKDGTL